MVSKGSRLLLVATFFLFAQSAFAQQYTVTELDSPSGLGAHATAINASGQVVGFWGNINAAIWEGGARRDLGALPGFGSCFAQAINDMGQVVGACLGADFTSRAFLWTADTGMTNLGTPDGSENWTDIRANGIANTGDIVGQAGLMIRNPRSQDARGAVSNEFLRCS
jgi:probable HAF family extracellular repeat protein